jgi:hypothetical protein
LPVRVERRHRRRFIGDGTFERDRRRRCEPHREIPKRRHEYSLEQYAARDSSREQQWSAQHRPKQQPGKAEAEHEAEQESR